MAFYRPPVANVEEVVRICPTRAERSRIRRDFNITFDSTVPRSVMGPWSCTPGGAESSVMLTVYNLFRLMRYIHFDAPMPLIGTTNLYSWLKRLRLRYTVTSREHNSAGDEFILFRWQAFSESSMRYWVNSRSGVGLRDLIALVLHEARHTDPGGDKRHNCTVGASGSGPHDSSLGYGGAWGLQYWYYVWLAEHSGRYLNSRQKHDALAAANGIRSRFICAV